MSTTSPAQPTAVPPGETVGAAAPPPRRGPVAVLVLLVAALLAVGAVLQGAWTLIGVAARETTTDADELQGVSSVDVDLGRCAGDVVVSPSAGSGASLRWHDSWALRAPRHSAAVVDGVLEVSVDCSWGWLSPGWGPASDLRLVVPTAAPVSVEVGAGDVSAAGLDGALRLVTGSGDVEVDGAGNQVSVRTGSGDVQVSGAGGRVDLVTGSGSVSAEGLTADEVSARTGSGDAVLAFTAAPRRLTATTGSGDLLVEVPDDGTVYAVSTDTGSGATRVDVPQDPRARRLVVLRTGSGDLQVVRAAP